MGFPFHWRDMLMFDSLEGKHLSLWANIASLPSKLLADCGISSNSWGRVVGSQYFWRTFVITGLSVPLWIRWISVAKYIIKMKTSKTKCMARLDCPFDRYPTHATPNCSPNISLVSQLVKTQTKMMWNGAEACRILVNWSHYDLTKTRFQHILDHRHLPLRRGTLSKISLEKLFDFQHRFLYSKWTYTARISMQLPYWMIFGSSCTCEKSMITIKSSLKFSTGLLTPYCLYISPLMSHSFQPNGQRKFHRKPFRFSSEKRYCTASAKTSVWNGTCCKECRSWCKLSVFHRNESAIPNPNKAASDLSLGM